ncbi:MAG: hypothetical protein J6Q57_03610, partial [Paraprevotella sp.]|nr:hypothetical protein [Paraprevotella sp.]
FCLVSLGASAQQVNGGFDETWVNCVPWTSANNTTKQGTQPVDWCVSNVIGLKGTGATTIASSSTGYNSSTYSVTLTNTPNPYMSSQIIPAYITLGTTWNTAKSNIFSVSDQDGGTFGGKSFTYKPDGIKFYYKRSHGTADTDEPAVVTAYLWKGTWSQASVPGETKIGTPSTATMTNRDRNILNMSYTKGGTVTKTNDAKLLAYLKEGSNKYVSIMGDASEWTEFTYDFTYDDTESEPEMINIIIAANDYFGGATAVGKGNSITVDNVELIYNSSLSDLKFNETTVHGFAKDNYNYYVAGNYTEGCITYTKDCVGGSVSESWDETTGVYTITVKGDDWSETNLNEHTYTVTFVDCIIEDGVTDIESLIGTSESKILLKRNFKAGWNTICLPFGSAKSYLGEGAEVYKLTTSSTNSDVITFTNNGTAALMANTPYLIYLPTAISNIVYTGRSITSTTIKTIAHNNWIFAGNYTQNMSMEGKWGVVNEGGKVRKGGSSSTLKGTRAYFTNKNNTAGVNEMRFIIDGEETSITEIDGEPLSYDVYNLNCMLVRKNATDLNGLRKGIYIVNGKKYIVK